jgi:hypothetical protein
MPSERRGSDPKPSRSHAQQPDPEQYQRFLEAAQALGLDPSSNESAGHLDEVVRRAAKLPPPHKEPAKADRKKKSLS